MSELDDSGVPAAKLAGLSRMAKAYAPGETICLEGEPSRDLLLMLSGSLEVSKSGTVINTIRGRQVFLGQIAFFNSQKRTATLKALTRCEIVRIREEKVEPLLAAMPSLALRLIRDLTGMFVEKEKELVRYQEYGTSANLALQAEGLTTAVEDYIPALVISILQDCSNDTRLAVLSAFIDALPSRCSLTNMTVGKKSIPNRLSRDARKELEGGLLELIREKTSGASDRAELSGSGLKALESIKQTVTELRETGTQLLAEDISLGAENELKSALSVLEDLTDSLEAVHIEQSLVGIRQFANHIEQVERFCRLQRSTDSLKRCARDLAQTADTLVEQLNKLSHQDREGVKRQDILRGMRFEL